MIKAVIFDCFGVLIGRGFDETYRLAGGNPENDADFIDDVLGQTNIGSISYEGMREAIAKRLHIPKSQWDRAVNEAEQPNSQLFELVKTLKPRLKTAILSNANVGTLQNRLTKDQLSLFDALVVSAEVGLVKPQPEIYKLVANKLDVKPEECVFIDDIQPYVYAARATGMQAIVYKDFEQCKAELDQILSSS